MLQKAPGTRSLRRRLFWGETGRSVAQIQRGAKQLVKLTSGKSSRPFLHRGRKGLLDDWTGREQA